jgi:hypothetical protein
MYTINFLVGGEEKSMAFSVRFIFPKTKYLCNIQKYIPRFDVGVGNGNKVWDMNAWVFSYGYHDQLK